MLSTNCGAAKRKIISPRKAPSESGKLRNPPAGTEHLLNFLDETKGLYVCIRLTYEGTETFGKSFLGSLAFLAKSRESSNC